MASKTYNKIYGRKASKSIVNSLAPFVVALLLVVGAFVALAWLTLGMSPIQLVQMALH